MALNISPETVFRLRNLRNSEKFQTFTPETQQRLANLDLQFDEGGNKHFITREDNVFTNPSLESLGKTLLLQQPFLGSSLSAPTERNLLGNLQRPGDALKQVQSDILTRPMEPVAIRPPEGPLDRFFTPARALGANMAESIGAMGQSAVKGFTAPRDTVQSPLGQAASQAKPISSFISERAKQVLAEGGSLGAGDVAMTTLSSTASDIVGMLNDLSVDAGLNAVFAGGGKAIQLGAKQLAGTMVGVELAKIDRFIQAVEKTAIGKGFRERFKQNYGDYIDVTFKKGKSTPIRTGTDVAPFGQPGSPTGLTIPPQLGLPSPGIAGQAAKPVFGAVPLGSQGPLPPLDASALEQGIRAASREPPVGAELARPTLEKPPRKNLINIPEKKSMFEAVKDVAPDFIKAAQEHPSFKAELPDKEIVQDILRRAQKDGIMPSEFIDKSIAKAKENLKTAPVEFKPIGENMIRQLENLKKKLTQKIDQPPAAKPTASAAPEKPISKGPARPLTPDEIKQTIIDSEDIIENLEGNLSASARRNKRGMKEEIAAVKAALQKQIDSGKMSPVQVVTQKRVLQGLIALENKIALSEGKTMPGKFAKPPEKYVPGDPNTPAKKGRAPLTPDEIKESDALSEKMLGEVRSLDQAKLPELLKTYKEDIASGKLPSFQEVTLKKLVSKLEEGKQPFTPPAAPKGKVGFQDLIGGEKPPAAPQAKPPAKPAAPKKEGLGFQDLLGGEKPPAVAPAPKPEANKVKILIQRAKNLLERFEKLPAGESKKALKDLPARLKEIIEKGPTEASEEEMGRFIKFIEAEEAATPKKGLGFQDLLKKEEAPKPVTPKAEAPKAEAPKPPAKKEGLGFQDLLDKPTGQFSLVNKEGKLTGAPFATEAAARGTAARLNKGIGKEDFTVRELMESELKTTAKEAATGPKAVPKKQTPLEEGIHGKPKKKKGPTPNVPALFNPESVTGIKIGGKVVTKAVADATKKFIDVENELFKMTKYEGEGPAKKVIDTKERNVKKAEVTEAFTDLLITISEEMGVSKDFSGKVASKLLKGFRGERGELVLPDLPFGLEKKLKAFRIKKLKQKREADFAKALGEHIKQVMDAAKKAGQSVEEFIRANPAAFPGAPKDLSSLQASLRKVLSGVRVDPKTLKVNDIVSFAGSGDLGIVESVGDVIKVRFQDGLSTLTPAQAAKRLRQTGSFMRLSKMDRKKLPPELNKILARNPKHQQLAEIANASIDAALKNPKDPLVQAQATQVTSRLIQAIIGKTIDINDIPSIVKHYNMSAPDFISTLVKDLRQLSSEAGQVLNLLSQNSKQLTKILKASGATDEEIAALFPAGPTKEPVARFFAAAWDKLNKFDQFTKGFLTSQLKTAMRNAQVQGGMTFGEMIEDTIVATYQKLSGTGITGKEFSNVKAYKNAAKSAFLDIISFAKNLRKLKLGPSARRRIYRILDEFPVEKANLLRAPIQDVFIHSKIIETINSVNVLQENFFRTLFVQKELSKFAARHGTTINNVPFLRRHMDEVIKAVERSLLNTFSGNLKNVKPLGDIIEFFAANPVLSSIAGNPFVRFATNNWYTILGRKQPLKLLNILDPKFVKALNSPNNEANLKLLAEGLMGTIAFATAWAIRSSDLAGDKFYQIKLPDNAAKELEKIPGIKYLVDEDNRFDARPFSPLPQYLFMVEFAKSMSGTAKSHMTASDWFQGMLSVSRIAGTGLVAVDLIRSEPFKEKVDPQASAEARERLIKSYFGQYLSRPSVFLRQFQDIVGIFDPRESEYKFIQGDPLLGPTLNNIPFVKRMLPDLQEIGRAEPRTKGRMASAVEFVTGLRLQDVNPFEQELSRLGLSSLHPGTGDPTINQRVIEEVQPSLAKLGAHLVKQPEYLNAKDDERVIKVKTLVERAFEIGRDAVKIFDEEASKTLMRGKIAEIDAKIQRRIAERMLDMYIRLTGIPESRLFSKTRRELLNEIDPLKDAELFSLPSLK